MIRTRLLGLDELRRTFAQLPGDLGKKVLRRGAGAGARVIKPAVIEEAPQAARPHRKGVPTGVLKRAAIIKFVREQSNDEQATYIVTFRQGKKAQRAGKGGTNVDAYYAKYVERGHKIVPRSKRIGIDRRGRAINAVTKRQRQKESNRFVPGKFFFAKAVERTQAAALRAMVETMNEEVRKVLP